MRIAVDVSSLNHPQISGVGVYITKLLAGLRAAGADVQPVWRASRWRSVRYIASHVRGSRPWLGGLGVGAQILHGPDFKVMRARGVARVVTIHDLGFLTEGMTSPEFADRKTRELEELLDRDTPEVIIAISQATRRDLVRFRPGLEARVHLAYLGGDHLRSDGPPLPVLRDGGYFLFVGNLEARKNVLGILAAFARFAEHADPTVRLKLVGKPGFQGEEILAAVHAHKFRSRIDVIGYCSLEQLQAWYRQAIALVYPSWIEGFGLPVIEAMHLGCPVITSSVTATAELAGDAGFLVDPKDTDAIAAAMVEVVNLSRNEEQRAMRVARGRERASGFTWSKAARDTMAAYQAALNTKPGPR